MAKLDKNTKHELKAGDVLFFSEKEKYLVRTVLDCGRNVSITVQLPDGRCVYLQPSSLFYGAEIIKNEEK